MDPAILKQMLAAQAEGLNPAAQELLRETGGTDNVSTDPQALMAALGQQSPAAAAVLQMMLARRASPAPVSECVIIDGVAQEISAAMVEGLTARLNAGAEEITRLTAELQAAAEELTLLQERSDLLADALGACSLCWGEDGHCRACRGHGQPGRSIPDQRLFEEFVLPAVRLLRASRQRPTVVTPLAPVTNRPAAVEPTPIRQISQ
jgi:hypothetical protein